MPKVSVVIPTFNRADTIGDSIKSVLEQTFKDFEVIVVDDGSTDGTESVVAAFGDSRIKYIMQDNAGACAARNNGIRHAMVNTLRSKIATIIGCPENLKGNFRISAFMIRR